LFEIDKTVLYRDNKKRNKDFNRAQAAMGQLFRHLCFLAVSGLVLVACSGCGGASSARAGAISVTAAAGSGSAQLSSLAVGQAARLTMTPGGDITGAGVDWAVTCGGSPLNGSITGGACGTLTPAHTTDAGATIYTAPALVPYLTSVTITATVTSNPAAKSTVTLAIVALPISVALTTPPPATIAAGQSVTVEATTLNDSAEAGETWTVTCGSASCGSFSPAKTNYDLSTTYTAPSAVPRGGTVTLTAASVTDPTKSASATVAITQSAIAVSISPAVFYASTSGTASSTAVTANVLNDALSGGVAWTLSCGSSACGAITAQTASGAPATYSAPSAVPAGKTVTLTATSVTDPTKSATAVATILDTAPVIVTITSPLAATLAESAQATLTAQVANDSANLGVDWTAACGSAGGCGSFSLSPAHTAGGGAITYTAPAAIPAGGTVTITATSSSTAPANPASVSTTIVMPSATIALTQAPPATVTATERVPVKASVTNDATPGGVTWSVQCVATGPGACGYVTPSQTANGGAASYVAPPTPPGGTVTVVATSTAFPALSVSSAPVTILPSTAISIGFVPFAPAQVTTGTTINLTAAVTNDSTNSGVDWQVCASGCGFFTTKAAIPAVPATPTTPLIPAVPAVTATSVQGWPNGLPIPYTAPDTVPSTGDVAIAATAHANSGIAVAQNVTVTTAVTGPSLQGVVLAGSLPVAGAKVSLYAAGTSGYGSAATALIPPSGSTSATTGSDGSFTFAGGYSCPSGGLAYLVATGGKAGTNAVNPNLAMMTALGPCSNLGSTPVVINEVTTVASVWPLAPFSTNQPLTGLSGYLNLGTSSTNTAGLANAFATVNSLVDVTTGEARYFVPAGNAAVPYIEINTLADALNACTASSGGQYSDGSACGKLFLATAPLYTQPQFNSLAPADTLQAAFNAAKNPAGGVTAYPISASGLFGLVSSASPFQPVLAAAPQDLGISLHYTSGGGLNPSSGTSSLAIDGSNNVWITATAGDQVIELNNSGAAISPQAGYTAGGIKAPGPIAIDSSNNVWVANSDSLTELNNNGLAAQGSPFYGVTNGLNMAIDGLDDIWITNPGGVTKYDNLGDEISPVGGYANAGIAGISDLTIDPSNDIWVGYNDSTGGFRLAELSDSNGQLIVSASILGNTKTPLVADASGDIWSTPANELCKLPPYGGTLTTDYVPSCTLGNTSQGGVLNTIYNPNGIALDGAGNLWIANSGSDATNPVTPPNLTEIVPSIFGGGYYGGLASPSLAAGPLQVALDGAGNAWVLLSDSSLTEYVGVAVPVVTPLSAAIKNKKVGKTP
jgi:hypothetical protein